MDYILSLSYGKDSLACLGAIKKLGLPLTRIVHCEIMATKDIPADLPPMIEFKKRADDIIKKQWGIEVEHVRSELTYESGFYTKVSDRAKPEYRGKIRGFPGRVYGQWCTRDLKLQILKKLKSGNDIYYLGIAADEPSRFHNLSESNISPLVKAGWTEKMCREWCVENDLLSPIYTTGIRGGCWFCHNQRCEDLRTLREKYPEYWSLLLKWDKDSPLSFKLDGRTVRGYEKRFQMEELGLVPKDRRFRWKMILDDKPE